MIQSSQLNQIQDYIISAFLELDEFCNKFNLCYFLRGGSVLGAKKYQNCVPWDDDGDISLPRNDYEKLIQLTVEKNWSEYFEIKHYTIHDDLHCYFPRLFLKETVRKENNLPKNHKLGLVLIDILPIDGMPENLLVRDLHIAKVYYYRSMAGTFTPYNKGIVDMHSGFQRMVLLAVKKILRTTSKYITQKQIYDQLDVLYRKYPYESSRYITTITGSLYHKEIFPKTWFGEGKILKMGAGRFRVPLETHKYLCKLYGRNYLKVEPSEKKKNFKKHIK